jgi:hypothetical protein
MLDHVIFIVQTNRATSLFKLACGEQADPVPDYKTGIKLEVVPNFWTGGLGVIFPFIKPPLAV